MKHPKKAANPKVAVAYLRVSTDDQKLGPQAQRAQIEAWAAKEGIEVASWHLDEGVSGGAELEDRPQLLLALSDLRQHQAGVFVVAKRDRLARDPVIAGLIEREVAKVGAKVVSADGVGNGSGPADVFMKTVIDGASAYERAIIRARIKAALGVKRTKGEVIGTVPWGSRVRAGSSMLEPDEHELAISDKIIALHAEGLSLRVIAGRLKAEGVVSRSGTPLSHTQVARIVTSRKTPTEGA